MKQILIFLLLFAALKVAGQTTGYLRFDTVKIMKQNGTCELYVINKTKDSLGLLTNVGGGLTQFRKSKVLNDSAVIVGLDTLIIRSINFANDGLTKVGDTVKLGQDSGAVGNPAALTRNIEIPMSDKFSYWRNGIFNVTADHKVDVSHPIFRVTSTSPLFHEMAEFRAKFVQETWMRSDSSDGYSGIGFALGGSHKFGIGTDGVADHNYLQTHAGFPIWIEDDASNTMAAFEADGDISMVVNDTGRNFGIGVTVPLYRVDINNTKTGIAYSDRMFNLNDAGTTYNTSGGARTNTLAYLQSTASKSTGGNTLTNQALYIRAAGADVNHGVFLDTPSTFVHGLFSNTNAWANFVHSQVVANTSSTQKFNEAEIVRSMQYSDTAAGFDANSASALTVSSTYRFKGTGGLLDNLNGGALKANLFIRRSVLGYTGAQVLQGFNVPTNDVTTMPTCFNARFDMSQVQSGGNSIRLNGWWSAITAWIGMNTGNSIGKFAWINTGAAQNTTGTTIDTGYAIWINTLPSTVGLKYALYQNGTADSSIIKGPAKFTNLQAEKTITAGGTTGDQTINKISGTVNFAGAATTLTVTNSFVTTTSLIFCTILTNDATARIANVVPGSGSFTINLTAAATGETAVCFFIVN